MDSTDMKLALNEEILAQGQQQAQQPKAVSSNTTANTNTEAAVQEIEIVKAKTAKKKANASTTEWNVATETGTFQGDAWPSHLPRPPSRKNLMADDHDNVQDNSNPNNMMPRVIVFNANTQEGSSMVRVLSEKGCHVIAVVRVFTSRNTKNLIKLKHVTVKVADLNNYELVMAAATNCQQAFLVTKYWERFENSIEEQMAKVVLTASAHAGITRLILATFEDTHELRLRNRKSQIMPTNDGRIFPKFDGMTSINELAKTLGVSLTHMMTSYLDGDGSGKKSLILIRNGQTGQILTQSHLQDNNSPQPQAARIDI